MATPLTAALETFTAGTETAVNVLDIERQLRELWQLAAGSDPANTAPRITRACLFNLVAYSETPDRHDHLTNVLRQLTGRYPCRAIVLQADPGNAGADTLTASLSAHCHLAGGGKQVCCEQITIRAAGRAVARLPGAVLPLLESDLPTLLWWDGNFLQRACLFDRLGRVADRVIFDTATWPPPVPLPALAAALTDTMTDLNWTRLGLWQQLLAEALDEPHAAVAATQLRRIEIVHGHGPGAALRARLLAGWLATQLGWPARDPCHTIHIAARDDTDTAALGLLSVSLAGPATEITVAKSHGQTAVSVIVNVPQACGLPRKCALSPTDDATVLCQALDRPTATASPYRCALHRAAALSAHHTTPSPPDS